MCLLERKTVRRGCAGVPLILRRMRSLRRSRPTIRMAMMSPYLILECLDLFRACAGALCGLAGLLADLLALVANAFAAVRLRRAEPADLRRRLAHEGFVGAVQDDDRALRVAWDLHRDPLRDREVHR